MKLEQLIVQHLYLSKAVTLQGIGTFRLDPHIVIPAVPDKDFVMPANAITFEYDTRATEDDALINFIVQHTRKMKPLATSDLESYIALSTQFLNIGKPLVIEGIGSLQKNQLGEFEFTPGNFVAAKVEDTPKPLKEKKEEAISFENEKQSTNSFKGLKIAVILLLLVIAGFSLAYFFAHKKHAATEEPAAINTTDTTTQATSTPVDTIKRDTTARSVAVDSSIIKSTQAKDSSVFKVIIKEYKDTAAANAAFRRISFTKYGSKLVLFQADSVYKLAIAYYNTSLADTTSAKNEIGIFFNSKPKIQF
ncbi:cyclin family protein [Ferruginibacter albus]|uniref:hypothetical protein n=1 Tax=Ferruginibacter albus TaxID=2875540 RepID=UPI001CC3E41C|nr:hypothetical protein [Ferruginibacter albus]UAY51009.1 hypothetical protein K9M53_10455 [Ferruginibacter albus]